LYIRLGRLKKGCGWRASFLPDLVLMDFGLPGMDGLGATQVLKANPATRHLTIVGLSAHAMKGDEEIALNAGCDGYLTKPINTRTFIATVRNFIASSNLRPQKTTLAHKNMQSEIKNIKSTSPTGTNAFCRFRAGGG